MFKKELQKYNELVYVCEGETTLKKLLLDKMNMSIRSIIKAKKDESIEVNGKYRKPSCEVRKGDVVKVKLSESRSDFEPQNLNLEIVYEDFDIIVVNKPPYMVVHPTKSHPDNTVANHVQYYFDSTGENTRPRFVNRLDMNTSGLVIVAKNSFAHFSLSEQMKKDQILKEYIAVSTGKIEDMTIDKPIYRLGEGELKRVIDDRGQESVTHIRKIAESCMEDGKAVNLLRIKLDTGRTHQIRVHLESENSPIYADELYGCAVEGKRQLLHARRLKFLQPRTKEVIDISSHIPEDMLEVCRKYSLGDEREIGEKLSSEIFGDF